MTVAIPFSRWGAQPYITYPFLYPIANTDVVRAPVHEPIVAQEKVRHPIRLALEWQQMLADNQGLNMAGIAQNKGVSRARVSQVMSLLRLPKPAQMALLKVTTPARIRRLSERRLRPIAVCSDRRIQQRFVQELVATVTQWQQEEWHKMTFRRPDLSGFLVIEGLQILCHLCQSQTGSLKSRHPVRVPRGE